MPELSVHRCPSLDGDPTTDFARLLGRGVAQLGPDGLGGELTLPLLVSAWIRDAGIGLNDAVESTLRLRSLLVETAGLDRAREPVPMVPRDPKTALVNLAVYVAGLVSRAARHAGCSREALTERALADVG